MFDPETREGLEKRLDALAREYAETHDEEVKAEIEELSLRLAGLKNPPVTNPLSTSLFLLPTTPANINIDKHGAATDL